MRNRPIATGVNWNDRIVGEIPCRCGCGRTISRQGNAPKAAYWNEGCKVRHAKLRDDMRRLRSIMSGFMPFYEYCPVLVWCHVLPLANAVKERNMPQHGERKP